MAIATGFFVMQNAKDVLTKQTLEEGKTYLHDIVNKYVQDHPRVKPQNITKVRTAIDKARTLNDLSFLAADFALAHPSEGLKVIR